MREQEECLTEEGLVKNGYKYRYKMLVEKSQSFREAIYWMEEMYSEREVGDEE